MSPPGWFHLPAWLVHAPRWLEHALIFDGWRWPLGYQVVVWLALAMLLSGLWSYGRSGHGLSRKLRTLLMSLRLISAALLIFLLAGPARWAMAPVHASLPRLVVLEDVSGSMSQEDVASQPGRSRSQAIRHTWLDPTYMAELSRWAKVDHFQFDKTLRPAVAPTTQHAAGDDDDSQKKNSGGTDLFGALDRVVGGLDADNEARPTGQAAASGMILVLSDGHDTTRTSDPALLARLRRKRWPVYVSPVGSDQKQPDVALLAWADSDSVLQGQHTTLHATITQHGFPGRQVKVSLWHEGKKITSRQVRFDERQDVSVPVNVDFEVTPQSQGRRPVSVVGYQVVVEPLAGEAHQDNNRRWVFLQVSRERIRIALFEGQPYWDTRFLAQTLGNDPQVDLTAVYGLGAGRAMTVRHNKDDASSDSDTFPWSESQLAKYDLVILGRGCEQFFPGRSASLLVDFVRKRGGALVLARGRAFDVTTAAGAKAQAILAPIEPVTWGQGVIDELKLALAPAGRRSPLLDFNLPEATDTILTRLPDMLAATRISREKAASLVLLTQKPDPGTLAGATGETSGAGAGAGAVGMAALVHQNVGAGQVLAVLSDGLWQWAFLPTSLRRYDSVYQQFWSRTIRWLAAGGRFLPGQSVSLTLSRLSVQPGQHVTVTAAARNIQGQNFNPKVNIIAPDGKSQNIPMELVAEQANRYNGRFTPNQPGVWIVQLLTPDMEPQSQTARLAVYDQSAELLDPSARPMTLHALAAATDGRVLEMSQRQELIHDLQQIAVAHQADRRLADSYDAPWVLVLLLLTLGAEWLIRKRKGLL